MTAPAAISGDFATYKHIQGRKMLQLVIEVPAEMASAVFAALGTPGSGEAIPVALARLNVSPDPIAKTETAKERRPFSELPYAQQAAMRSQEPDFLRFLQETDPLGWSAARDCCGFQGDEAAEYVRRNCQVTSRADIAKGTAAGERWATLEAQYFAWSRGMR